VHARLAQANISSGSWVAPEQLSSNRSVEAALAALIEENQVPPVSCSCLRLRSSASDGGARKKVSWLSAVNGACRLKDCTHGSSSDAAIDLGLFWAPAPGFPAPARLDHFT